VYKRQVLNRKARELLAKLSKEFPDISVISGGEDRSTRESFKSLLVALVLSIIAILAILIVVYNSFLVSLLILSTIPLGLAGVGYVFFLAGIPLSFMALIGVIGLGGVIINASIVLLSFITAAREADPSKPLLDLVAEVTTQRFKAVFITNATTIMGLLPTAYGLGGQDPLLVPLTLAMGWGLLVGSALSILWVPCSYIAIEDWLQWRAKRR